MKSSDLPNVFKSYSMNVIYVKGVVYITGYFKAHSIKAATG